MKASIEKIERNSDGIHTLKVFVLVASDAEELRLGAIELSQKKYEQKKLGDEQ